MDNKQLLYAYLAGIVDGEGSISVKSESKQRPHICYLTVTNCNKAMIVLFEQEFGGKVRLRKWKNKKWKPAYEWSLTKQQAACAVRLLVPYLRVKKVQALLVLRLASIKQMYTSAYLRWHPDVYKRLLKIYDGIKKKCKMLNQRGVVSEEKLSRSKLGGFG